MAVPRREWVEYWNTSGDRKMKEWKPIFVENSKIPVILSKIAPINIRAISLGFFVFSRDTMSETTKRHETIHFQQQLEMLIIFQWLFYFLFWFYGFCKLKNGRKAYFSIPFEKEAYQNELDTDYLKCRPRFAWLKYM